MSQPSQSFVRALKAPSDPPQPGGPSKIEIARNVWDDASIYVPGKGEVIVDWILTRLLKDKTKIPETSPVLDNRFWALLSDVISSTDSTANARPLKTWLSPLLSRIPIASIAISFLNLSAFLEDVPRQRLARVVYRCFLILWPLGVQKLGFDTLSDCFSAVLGTFKRCESNESLADIGLVITSSFRTSLESSSNKKKLYVTFTQSQLYTWLECASIKSNSSGVYRSLLDNIYAAGVEALFNLDILRQHHDSKSENSLFEALVKNIGTSPSQVINVLPRLFASYVQCIKKYRGALFSQSSSHPSGSAFDEVRSAGMNFFVSCYSTLDHANSDDQFWTTRVALLSIVDSENLFSARQLDMEQLLKQTGELATEALFPTRKVDQTKLAIDVLSTLMRIDYDLVAPTIPRIFPKMLLVYWPLQAPFQEEPISQVLELNKSAFAFLDLLLDYHAKTRTMHIYIQSLFIALSTQPFMFPSGPQSLYQVASSGPLLNSSHLGRLGKCVHGFLTSGQIVETVRKVLDSLKGLWQQFYGADAGKCSKKRKKVEVAAGQTNGAEAVAVSFSLSVGIASVVLGSLPVHSAPDAVRRDVQTLIDEAQTAFISTSLNQTLRDIHKQDCGAVWASQIVAAATLRFQYALEASAHLHLQISDPKLLTKILDMLSDDEILPELHLEMFRILLAHSAQGFIANPTIFLDSLLDYLDHNFSTAGVTWCGLSCRLTLDERGKKAAALALFHLIIDRWMPILDGIASVHHLERLGHFLLSINIEEFSSSFTDVRPSACLVQALRSAEFWELPNMRNILLSMLNNKTSILDQVDMSQTRSSDMQQVQHAISAYDKLLFVPIEYLSRTSRTDFVRRALIADIVVSEMAIGENSSKSYDYCSLTVLRTFLKRVFVYLGAVDHTTICEFLEHMLNTFSSPTVEFSLVTLDLIEIHFLALLRPSQKLGSQAISQIIQKLGTSSSDTSSKGQMEQQAVVRLVGLLGKSFTSSDFPEEIRVAMVQLRERLLDTFLPQMIAATAEGVLDHATLGQNDLFIMWCHILSFGQWLRLSDAATPKFGRLLVTISLHLTRLLDSADQVFEDMCAATLAILLEELHACSELGRSRHVEVIVAAYISLSLKFESYNPIKFDVHISRTCKFFSISDFSLILDLISEELANANHDSKKLACLTHLSVILLHEVPQGTLQLTQNFITRCLSLFSDHHTFSIGPLHLQLQVLDFVGRHCSDRPAVLRPMDLNCIWSLLSKFLAQSQDHDEKTSTAIFHEIVNIISALIRLRRDLVILTLPHLGMILRQLIMSIRGLRPQLGAKQSKLVTDTLPKWICVSQPLTAAEGKVLARLLVNLTTKSIMRTHSSYVQKAESLAKPFSKHAAYVLKAYIEVMNEPLCVVDFELRRELEPGLFALCSMLSEYSRDAMMISMLDAGGKTILKTLWKQYEKQRYIGKG